MWKLKRPEALLDYYGFDEDCVMLGHMTDISYHLPNHEDDTDIVFVPYRFGMNLEKIAHAISEGDEDEDRDRQVVFYLDTLEVYALDGVTDDNECKIKRLAVPKGVRALWFLKTEGNIETHEAKLVFIDSCPHTWDGIDNVSLITVDIGTNQWCQQSLGEPNFIKDCLQECCRLDADAAYSWGNDDVYLVLNDDGTQMDITSGFNGEHIYIVTCVWGKDRWAVDKRKLASENAR